MEKEAASLLLEILDGAAYFTDQSGNLKKLKDLLIQTSRDFKVDGSTLEVLNQEGKTYLSQQGRTLSIGEEE